MKAEYTFRRVVHTFTDLKHGADILIEKSEVEPKDSYYTDMGALLLTAFTLEAYLNHLLQKKTPYYEQLERLSIDDKFSFLCKHFGWITDKSARPFQTVTQLFKFRNAIAHGKSEVLRGTKIVELDGDFDDRQPRTRWEEFCTHENAKRAQEDICTVVEKLHNLAGLGGYPFTRGLGTGSFKPLSSEKP